DWIAASPRRDLVAPLQQNSGRALPRARPTEHDRQWPALRRGRRVAQREAVLPQAHALLATAARDFGDDERNTRLLREARRDRCHGLARGFLESLPQIRRRRVAVGVIGHVFANAGAERSLAEIVLQHADQ